MGWNADGTCSVAGGGFNCNRSSVAGGVFGTDDATPSRPPRQRNVAFDMDTLHQAEQRDTQQMQMQRQQQMQMQQQQQQQMQMQRQQQQMQMQRQQQQQMQTQQQQQQQMQMQRQQQMQMQQQQQQMQQQPSRQASSPPGAYDDNRKKNTTANFSLGGDTWGESAPSHRGGKVRKGITPKDCGGFAQNRHGSSPPGHGNAGAAAGGFSRDRVQDRYGGGSGGAPGRVQPGGASSISLGSDSWDGSAASPRHNKAIMGRGQAAPMRTSSPMQMEAAGGQQRYDNRTHLGSNVCFG